MRLKSTYFLVIFLFVISCTPQVTVTPEATVTLTPPPTEPPVPTPTLHPQFAALQETIAASGGRFTLGVDGLLYDNDTPIPDITVAPDGTMTLTVNGEIVTLDPADVSFDDDGIDIDGYEWDDEMNGWTEATMSEAMTAAQDYFEKLGYSTTNVEFREGEVTTTGWVDGQKVFEMNNKSLKVLFDQNYVIELTGEQKLMPTEFEPRLDTLNAGGMTEPVDHVKAFNDYFHPLYERVEMQFPGQFGYELPEKYSVVKVLLDSEINAWASILEINYKDPSAPRYLVYELGDSEKAGEGTILIVPLMPENK